MRSEFFILANGSETQRSSVEKTVTNSLLISLVVVEAVHTICFASSEKNRWKKSRTHQMMPRCRMMQQSAPITSNI